MLILPLSQGRKWGLGAIDGKLVLLQSRIRRSGYGEKKRIWLAFPYPAAAPRYATKSELLRVLHRKGIRMTKGARLEISELPELFADWPAWYQDERANYDKPSP